MQNAEELEYVGFWLRVWASLIDTVLLMLLILPLAMAVYGTEYFYGPDVFYGSVTAVKGPWDFILSYVLPALVIIVFWKTRQATPGKMAIGARIVDAKTGGATSLGQDIIRYLGYFISALPFCLGFIWVGLDRKKQGWHDKLAGTVVVRARRRGTESVRFE